jgi:hypothetical protein
MKPLIEKHLEETNINNAIFDFAKIGGLYLAPDEIVLDAKKYIIYSHFSLAVKILESQIEEIEKIKQLSLKYPIRLKYPMIRAGDEFTNYNIGYSKALEEILSHLEKELSEIKSLSK